MRYAVDSGIDHRMFTRTASRIKSVNLNGYAKRGGIRF